MVAPEQCSECQRLDAEFAAEHQKMDLLQEGPTSVSTRNDRSNPVIALLYWKGQPDCIVKRIGAAVRG
jgi:hypothetical protein